MRPTIDEKPIQDQNPEQISLSTPTNSPGLKGINIPDDLAFRSSLLAKLSLDQILDSFPGIRINQLKAIESLREKLRDESWNLSGYIVQPTGAGKTILFGLLARILDLETVIFVPKTNLLEQTKAALISECGFPENEIGVIGGDYREFAKKITIITYQSHLSLMGNGNNPYKQTFKDSKFLVFDEAHKSLGKKTVQALNHEDEESPDFKNGESFLESALIESATDETLSEDEETAKTSTLETLSKSYEKLKLAFTATPKLSQKHVRDVFGDEEISRVSYKELVEAGILVPYKIFHTTGYLYIGEDFEPGKPITMEQEELILEREMTYEKLLDLYLEKSKKLSTKFKTGVFCASIKECDHFMELAKLRGLKSMRVTGKDEPQTLKIAEQALLNGEIDFIATVDKLTEGWDFKPLDAVIHARATRSPARLIQGSGRSARTYPGKEYSHIFETDWLIGRIIEKEQGDVVEDPAGGKNDDEPKDDTPGGKITLTRTSGRLNLLEALILNGESAQDLGIIFKTEDGTPINYSSFETKLIEEIQLEIIKAFPTANSWASLGYKEKNKIKIAGLGLIAIATKFGINGNPICNHEFHIELGKKIYGENAFDTIQQEELESIKQEILNIFPTANSWAGLSVREKKEIKIAGQGLMAIATKFGINGNPICNHEFHIELGKKVYGEDAFDTIQQEELESIKQEILNIFPTANSWANLGYKEKNKIKIAGLGLKAIATKFGINVDPISNHEFHIELGKKIYGENAFDFLEPQDPESIKQEILKMFPTANSWARLMSREKLKIKIAGLGLTAIATKFGINGNPTSNHEFHIELGKKIYGEDAFDIIQKEELESIKQEILMFFPTANSWASLGYKEKKAIKIAELGLNAIATKFGINGHPTNNHEFHIELGKKIYGEHAFD